MKPLKSKKGFTLVECVVAMAVLAIMSLLLTMILSVTLAQRNSNIKSEKEIDKQVENIVGDKGTVETKDISSDIKFFANGAELGDVIPGNTDGAKAEKIEHQGDGVNFDSLDYDFDSYKKFENIANGKIPGGAEDDPGPGYEKSKCFGALNIDKGEVTVKEKSRMGKRKSDGAIVSVVDGEDYEYYIITWNITFNAKEASDEKSVKLRIPPEGKLSSADTVNKVKGNPIVDNLSNTAVRIQATTAGDIEIDIKFKVSADDIDDYGCVEKFFKGSGEGSSAVVKMDY
ncbi:MAG TPA: hypothetical protein DDX91_05375 [Ruminococcaceae bacterium]|nr:hypothetical protein [Oscillospiraceae bacterium]